MKNKIKAYKVFNPDWTCRGFQYEIGKTYKEDRAEMCVSGFHACLNLSDCFNYYKFDPENKVAEVYLSGDICTHDSDSKICATEITLVRELEWSTVLGLCNFGNSNSGNRNSGYSNSGDCNSGYRNSGDWNSCNYSCGFFNSKPQLVPLFNGAAYIDRDHFVQSDWYMALTSHPFILTEVVDNKLVEYTYHEACKTWWGKLSEYNKKIIQSIPGFDAEIFKDITGVDVDNE